MIETEVKIKITSEELSALPGRLSEIGAQEVSPLLEEANILFDFPDRRLKKGENALRLRLYGDAATLTFKGDPVEDSTFKKREELESGVADGPAVEAILERLGLEAVLQYGKWRQMFQLTLFKETGLICLDETPVGKFVELEGSEEWIGRLASRMGWPSDQFIKKTYIELYEEAQR